MKPNTITNIKQLLILNNGAEAMKIYGEMTDLLGKKPSILLTINSKQARTNLKIIIELIMRDMNKI